MSKDANQDLIISPHLFQPELYRINWSWEVDGKMLTFVSLNERHDYVQFVAFRSVLRRTPECLHAP